MTTNDEATLAQAIVRGADEAVIVADTQGIIVLWNGGAERIIGYPADEALGRSLDLIIPEKQRAPHWEGYDRVMRTGVTSYAGKLLAVPAMHRDGRRISLEFSVALIREDGRPDGAVTAIAALMRDVTERWHADRALRKELAELRSQCPVSSEARADSSSLLT